MVTVLISSDTRSGVDSASTPSLPAWIISGFPINNISKYWGRLSLSSL